jgi:D-alanyl-D-alanine carboxypeptidase (penicillin-binding protein 5/6)
LLRVMSGRGRAWTATASGRRAALWLAFGLVPATGAGLAATVATPAWAARLVPQLPAAFTFPGAAPRLPWPAAGQAALAVEGLGPVGASGPTGRSVPIASVAKVLTAYQVLIDHPLAAGAAGPTLTVSRAEAAAYGRQLAQNQSLVRVTAGERLTERQALQALLLASADNVAQVLARWDAGNVPGFLRRANKTAARLGMAHSRYTDPSGLDRGTVSTAPDQLLLAQAAMRLPAFAELVGERTATIPVAGRIRNFNTLLGQDGVVGVKTGSTSAAGGCLLFAATLPPGGGPSRRLFGAVLGQPGTPATILHNALAAAQRLIRAARPVVGAVQVAPAGRRAAVLRSPMHRDRVLVTAAALTVTGWPGQTYAVEIAGTQRAPELVVRSVAEPAYQVVSPLRPGR